MLLNLIKVVVKNILHQAAEEWAEEFGLPESEVSKLRICRVGLAAEALNAEIEQYRPFQVCAGYGFADRQSMTMSNGSFEAYSDADAVYEPTKESLDDDDGSEQEIDDQFWRWVSEQRQQNVTWSKLAQAAADRGHELSENAIRLRYRRWCGQDSKP